VSDKPSKSQATACVLPPAKQRQILDGARQVFLEVGFERACMDHIAARAEVSKATIYNHFHDKKDLFLACIREHTREKREALASLLGSPSGHVEQDLQRFGETLMRFLTTRDALALRRIILADTDRFPELGQALFDEGPLAMRHRLAAYLQLQSDAGALRLEDVHLAAHQFILLCQGDLYLPVEYGILRDPPEERIRETVQGAVRTFLRAYGPR
jgi:TetR/AcrR family transcriptional repressor of mexJK operon